VTPLVLHVISGLGIGGAEGMLVRLAVALQARGIPQHIVSLRDRGAHAQALQAHGIGLTTLGVNSVLSAPVALINLVGLIYQLSPGVIQGWMYHGNIFAAVAQKVTPPTGRRALFWSLRSSNMDDERYRNVISWSSRLSHWPDVIIANSESGVVFHKSRGFNPRQMLVIYNGIDCNMFRPDSSARRQIRQELGIPIEMPVVIHPARVDQMKDHESFLKAMEKLPAITALMVGTGTDQLETLRSLGCEKI